MSLSVPRSLKTGVMAGSWPLGSIVPVILTILVTNDAFICVVIIRQIHRMLPIKYTLYSTLNQITIELLLEQELKADLVAAMNLCCSSTNTFTSICQFTNCKKQCKLNNICPVPTSHFTRWIVKEFSSYSGSQTSTSVLI